MNRNDTRLVVTIPCGAPAGPLRDARFSVLQRTIKAARPLLQVADEILCLANFGDRRTKDWLRSLDVNPRVILSHRRQTNPQATELLLKAAVQQLGADYVLHLEDDWWLHLSDDSDAHGARVTDRQCGWLGDAIFVLENHADVGQVRLRRQDDYEPETYHWVTGAPIVRESKGSYELSNLHCTYNPALWRAEAALGAFPGPGEYRDEQASMRCYDQAGWRSASLIPGVFMHRDDGCSLEGVWR